MASAQPLTDGELARLAVVVQQRREVGRVLGDGFVDDRRTLDLVWRLVEAERERRTVQA